MLIKNIQTLKQTSLNIKSQACLIMIQIGYIDSSEHPLTLNFRIKVLKYERRAFRILGGDYALFFINVFTFVY